MSEEVLYSELLSQLLTDESDPSDPEYEHNCEEDSDCVDSELEADFEEEVMDMFQIEIEEAVESFRDEVAINHHEVAISDDEEESALVHVKRVHRVIRRGDGNLYLGRLFPTGVAFKEAVLDFALKHGCNIKQYMWDQTKLGYKCASKTNCPWRCYCSVDRKKNAWEIKVLDGAPVPGQHSCTPNSKCEMMTAPIIARLFLDKIRQDPDSMMPLKIRAMVREQWQITPTQSQCQEARKKCLKWIRAEYEDQFAHIRGYCQEISDSNPGSTVVIETCPRENGNDVFDRFYVCFANISRSWRTTCRPLIGLDATFLRGTSKGQLLVALGRDACNKMYPIAWGVVEVEDEKNWLWFVKLLKSDLELGNGEGFIVMSDRQKGLINAVQKEIPQAEHRKCVRHIYQNLKAKHGKKMEMKPFIWQLAWSYNSSQYTKHLQRLEEYDLEVYNDVLSRNPETWCLAFYKVEGSCCEDVENNSVESFNNSIVKAREKPLMAMLETIRRLAMVRISKRATIANKHQAKFTPYVKQFLEEEHKQALKCTVFQCRTGRFEVVLGVDVEDVDMENKTCTCCKWQICGIPCEHAYGVILDRKLDPDDFVSDWFLTSRWRETYSHSIYPLRGPGHWIRGDIALVGEDEKRQKKDKKEKRKKGKNESPSKKKTKKQREDTEAGTETGKNRRVMHCKKCGSAGHNARTCGRRSKQIHDDASGSQCTQAMSQVDQA